MGYSQSGGCVVGSVIRGGGQKGWRGKKEGG